MVNKYNKIKELIINGNFSLVEKECRKTIEKNKYNRHIVKFSWLDYFIYAVLLMNIDKISTSLIYYEKALKECKKEIEKELVNKYRALALAKFHDTTALEILKEIKEKEFICYADDQSSTNYFYYLACYYLNKKINKEEIINKNTNDPSNLLVCTAYLLQNGYDKEIIDKIYFIFNNDDKPLMQDLGIGHDLVYELYSKHKGWFYNKDINKIIEKWLNVYGKNYVEGIKKVERKIEERYSERPLLKPCDMNKCNGYCCYDGVYL